jgi:AcrR family transcriptional regulator
VTGVVRGAPADGPHPPGSSAGAVRTDGRSSRWAAHRIARREELIGAAIAAIGQYGAAVGMDQIAVTAGTSKPVIYRYFADKTDLYRAVSQRVVGHVLDGLIAVTARHPSPRELIHAGVDAYLVLLEANPELFRFVCQNQLVAGPAGGGRARDFGTVVADVLARHLTSDLSATGLDPALAHPWAEAIVGFIRAASIWWLDNRTAMTRQQLADYLSGLLWDGAAGVYRSAAAS